MIEGIRIYLTEGDETVFSQISGMETEADRLYWLIVRQLLLSQRSWKVAKEIGVVHPYHIVGNRAIVKALEDIADRINDVGEELRRIPEKWIEDERGKDEGAIKKLDEFLGVIDEMVGDSMQSFIELNIFSANDVINKAKKIKDRTKELDIWFLSAISDPVVLSSLRLILGHLMRVIDNVQLIAEITMNRSLESPSEFYYWEAVEKREETAK
jgi:phosphate uptake regulator